MTKIYLAGKIAPHDWREEVALVGIADSDELRNGDGAPPAPTCYSGVMYVGPFFAACDHGCSHAGDRHGQAEGCMGIDRNRTARGCLSQIELADLVYAWLDDLEPSPKSTAYGTLVEVGYALALGKPVVVAAVRAPHDPASRGVVVDRYPIDDLWFAWTLATGRIEAKTPKRGLDYVIENLRDYTTDLHHTLL